MSGFNPLTLCQLNLFLDNYYSCPETDSISKPRCTHLTRSVQYAPPNSWLINIGQGLKSSKMSPFTALIG